MNRIVESVRELEWVDDSRTRFNCIVKLSHLKKEVPFTASKFDSEEHGRTIFFNGINGHYGEIKECDRPETIKEGLIIYDNPSDELIELFELLEESNRENFKKSWRSLVILWSSYLDKIMTDLLIAFLVNDDRVEKLIDNERFAFSSKVTWAFALGLITQEEFRNCKSIAKIRNKVAHDWKFTITDVIEKEMRRLYESMHSDLFHYVREEEFFIQHIYMSTCAQYALSFRNRIEEAKQKKLNERN